MDDVGSCEALLETALSMHQQGRLEAAEKLYRDILNIEPGHCDANHLLGLIFIAGRKYEEAERQISIAIAIAPNLPVLHNSRSSALLEMGQFDEGLASCDRAIVLQPDYAEAHCNRGYALERLGRPGEAVLSYEKALALKPDYQMALNNRSRALSEFGREDYLHPNLYKPHPVDIQYSIDTSGYVNIDGLVDPDLPLGQMNDYAGVQPSVVRQILQELPDLEQYCFVDLGCGKGRAVVVASEFPLKQIIGVEIAADLADIAKNNAKVIAESHPLRTPIEIIQGDATDISYASGKLIFFLYNPFGEELIRRLVRNLEEKLSHEIEHLFVVYHNAKAVSVFDESASLSPCLAIQLQCDAAELPFGYPSEGPTIIWQSRRGLNLTMAMAWARAQLDAGRRQHARRACEAVLAVEPGHAGAKGVLREIEAPGVRLPFGPGRPGVKVVASASLHEQIRLTIEKGPPRRG